MSLFSFHETYSGNIFTLNPNNIGTPNGIPESPNVAQYLVLQLAERKLHRWARKPAGACFDPRKKHDKTDLRIFEDNILQVIHEVTNPAAISTALSSGILAEAVFGFLCREFNGANGLRRIAPSDIPEDLHHKVDFMTKISTFDAEGEEDTRTIGFDLATGSLYNKAKKKLTGRVNSQTPTIFLPPADWFQFSQSVMSSAFAAPTIDPNQIHNAVAINIDQRNWNYMAEKIGRNNEQHLEYPGSNGALIIQALLENR